MLPVAIRIRHHLHRRWWKMARVAHRQKREAVSVKDVFFCPAVNTTKHLWAGAIAAMVSRTFVAPLERLKLEYIVRGEQSNIFELVKKIALTQGLFGFWKGNFINVLRTAPFKAVNFYAYDTYRKQLLRLSGNEETTNSERFIAGAAAGITATVLCLPLDTIRTKIVAPGGEALGGVIGAFRHMIQTEEFFSLYKGLVPSIVSMAPSAAVFYSVYDILKSAYLRSPEELGPMRTLLYGAMDGACAEVATYPFEVVRRQLQLQVQARKMGALATGVRIENTSGSKVGRIQLFDMTHTKKDGTPMTADAAEIMVLLMMMTLKTKLLMTFWVLKDMVGCVVKDHSLLPPNILDSVHHTREAERASAEAARVTAEAEREAVATQREAAAE
ncbi:putative mitochondrial adenine nucleotide transporter BTL3 [Hibiscus syriacus]|uniref:Mitochondrial adenine nucleotide transporter BTL3 n=1 Tax=Hibiscus syriacus TaxID=106335 RepID=A0A6A2WHS3_HIBSY|nr:putative mitochondrial adenine nucleotide transporter BTL3 [Hibiscus syriacus]